MKQEPIDYNNPLGISKREWTKVLGVNLALLLLVYATALICTLCGSNLFLLNFHSDDLQRIEDTLRGWNIFPLLQIAFKTIEVSIVGAYITRGKFKWWFPLCLFATFAIANFTFTQLLGGYPSFIPTFIYLGYFVILIVCYYRKNKFDLLKGFARMAIGVALSLSLNFVISIFRTKVATFFDASISNVVAFALNVEYIIALVLSLLFLSLLINWEPRKGGCEECPTNPGACGSSPQSTKPSPKNMRNTKKNPSNIPPKLRKRIRLLKAKMIAIQTSALVIVSLLPIVSGRGVEYALVFASFSLTRFCLGFNRSLHFKSEALCVSVAGVMFWALCFLAPNVEACLIMSMVYGGAVAIGFRLYWELHDLILYKRVAKLDRYAIFYVCFKGNSSPRHILGVLKSKGYSNEDVTMVTLYMERVKVEAIALDMNYSKRVIEDRLTTIANELDSSR